jgi:hypothetical protein
MNKDMETTFCWVTYWPDGNFKDRVIGQQNMARYNEIRPCFPDNIAIFLTSNRLSIIDCVGALYTVTGEFAINRYVKNQPIVRNVDLECAVCFKEARRRVAYSCGHMAVCQECDKRLKACPLCRSPIVLHLNVILP